MRYKIFSIFFSFFILVSPVFAQQDTPVTVEPSQPPKGDVSFTDPEGKGRIGSYETLARLPGLPAVIDPGLESGDAGSFTLPQYIRTLVRIAIGVIGILAVVMIVISGVQYMGSAMVTEKEGAKQRLTGAVLGLILAVSSVLLLRTINPQLTNLSIGTGVLLDCTQATKKNAEGKEVDKDGKVITDKTKQNTVTIYVDKDGKENPKCNTAKAELFELPEDLQISGGNDFLKEIGQYTGSKPNVAKNITTYDAILKQAAKEYNVSCTVLKAHAFAESNMNPKAQSKAGAKGLIQLMPKTFASAKVGTDPFDPLTNARAAAFYINQLKTQACGAKSHKSCTEDPYSKYVTAAYNGGPGINFPGSCGQTKWECREKYKGGVNNETIEYVDRVWANITILKTNGWGCD